MPITTNQSGPQGPKFHLTEGDAQNVDYHPADPALWPGGVDPGSVNDAINVLKNGAGSPGGSSADLQYNNAGAFGGTSGLTWDGTNLLLALAQELRFRASGNKIYSRAADILTILAVATVEVGADGDCGLFASTLRALYPIQDLKGQLGKDTNAFALSYIAGVVLRAGVGTGRPRTGGILSVNTTAVGNVGVGEDDLMTYSVPADSLDTDKASIWFEAAGTIANNINAKRLRVKFGATTIFDTGAAGIPVSNAIDWTIRGRIIRTGATAQACLVEMNTNNATLAAYADYATAAETLSGAVTLKLTGEAVSNDDISQKIMAVGFHPAI